MTTFISPSIFYPLHVLNRIITSHDMTSEFDSFRGVFVPNSILRYIYHDSEVRNHRSKIQEMDAASLEAEKEREIREESDLECTRWLETAASKALIRSVGILGQCSTSLTE